MSIWEENKEARENWIARKETEAFMNEQTEFWKGEFGDSYTQRNQVDWRARIPFWDRIIQQYGIRSVFELGINAGWNFSAIKAPPITAGRHSVECSGIEINELAYQRALVAGHINIQNASLDVVVNPQPLYDLVFTSGVLIHISPSELPAAMNKLIAMSCRYVMAVEYEADEETHVTYRDHEDRLWKRPYGELYQELGLKLVETGEAEGFDRCTYWLMEKANETM